MTPSIPRSKRPRARSGRTLLGFLSGVILTLILVVVVGMPLVVGHHQDLPLERVYGDLAVSLAIKTQAGSATNPLAQNARALETGRLAYTGSCAVCHGAAGDGKGTFGTTLYPPATNLQQQNTQERSDAELFWIIKNGLSFLGMPGFSDRYDDAQLWALVAYTRSLGSAQRRAAEVPPAATTAQLAVANRTGDPTQRGAAIYFAQGCDLCHGAVGTAPGELGLRGGREAAEAVRRGRRGMPAYDQGAISDGELNDLITYMNTFRGRGG
jgi:mono/diheme cytochrome c family protein